MGIYKEEQVRFENIDISLIDGNKGQVKGLPENPRRQTESNIKKLEESIKQDPELLDYRGLLVFPYKGRYVSIGGNMRLKALRNLGYKNVPCIILPENTPTEKLKAYILKDNGSFGEWDYKLLNEHFAEFNLDALDIKVPENDIVINDAPIGVTAWNDKEREEARCNLSVKPAIHEKIRFSYISLFKKSNDGKTLTEIKSDFNNTKLFAETAANYIKMLLSLNKPNEWCIVTTPKRRHKETNFADVVCQQLSKLIGVKYHRDLFECKNKSRVEPEFSRVYEFEENNVIVFDDIVTTGFTLTEMSRKLYDKNTFYVVGIQNNN